MIVLFVIVVVVIPSAYIGDFLKRVVELLLEQGSIILMNLCAMFRILSDLDDCERERRKERRGVGQASRG